MALRLTQSSDWFLLYVFIIIQRLASIQADGKLTDCVGPVAAGWAPGLRAAGGSTPRPARPPVPPGLPLAAAQRANKNVAGEPTRPPRELPKAPTSKRRLRRRMRAALVQRSHYDCCGMVARNYTVWRILRAVDRCSSISKYYGCTVSTVETSSVF